METWQQKKFEELVTGKPTTFIQDNHSKSSKGILRGLHYQTENTQGKLVRVIVGEVFDVAVDIRKNSPSFGQWVGGQAVTFTKKYQWKTIFRSNFIIIAAKTNPYSTNYGTGSFTKNAYISTPFDFMTVKAFNHNTAIS